MGAKMDIESIKAMYANPQLARGLRMEREFSPDGEIETGLFPYTRIRIVPTYDAMRYLETREMVQVGLIVEIW